MKRDDPNGIDERSAEFLFDVMTYVATIRVTPGVNKVIEQLVDAAGSIGANRDEASGGSSRREFIRYNEIALRSANESVRWLRACHTKGLGDQATAARLLDEARQLARILGAIVINSKRRDEDNGTSSS